MTDLSTYPPDSHWQAHSWPRVRRHWEEIWTGQLFSRPTDDSYVGLADFASKRVISIRSQKATGKILPEHMDISMPASVLHKIEMITHISRITLWYSQVSEPKVFHGNIYIQKERPNDQRGVKEQDVLSFLTSILTWVIVIVFHIMWLVHEVSWTELLPVAGILTLWHEDNSIHSGGWPSLTSSECSNC